MIIEMSRFLLSLSKALDYADRELVGVKPYHAARVALITNRLMEATGHSVEQCYAATAAALLHDCALKEYLSDETGLLDECDPSMMEHNMGAHCAAGEEIGKRLPFSELVKGAILYHHERADGKGPFEKKAAETPDYSQFIHIADLADVFAGLSEYSDEKAVELRRWLLESRGTVFSDECVDLFNSAVDDAFLASLSGEISQDALLKILPGKKTEISIELLRDMSLIFADITDYKSHFTWRHSSGIAQKAYKMGKYYAFSENDCTKLYIAGLLHDIGKLCIPDAILEKPGKLDADEYKIIQNHAIGTWDLLKDISGMEDITSWAALHHEKLDGSGYPFGYTAQQLSKLDRLMACLDIYQALTEERPYKAGLNHAESMAILNKMGSDGQLDTEIIHDVERCFADLSSEMEPEQKAAGGLPAFEGEFYRCPVCGYIHEGELPREFICPGCGQPVSVFEKVQI